MSTAQSVSDETGVQAGPDATVEEAMRYVRAWAKVQRAADESHASDENDDGMKGMRARFGLHRAIENAKAAVERAAARTLSGGADV